MVIKELMSSHFLLHKNSKLELCVENELKTN